MFSAMPSERTRRLEFFRLALVLVDRHAELPPSLSAHFDQVLREARLLVLDPHAVTPDVAPQAIHLAIDLLRGEALRDALCGIERISDVSPEMAHEVLRKLEPTLASPD
jgi:hypothetical protein